MKQNGTLGFTIGINGTYQQRTVTVTCPHKAGGEPEIRSWHGSELDDAAQGPASGSAHVWRPCMLAQSEEARPGPLAAEALVPCVLLPRLAQVGPKPTVTHPSRSLAVGHHGRVATGSRWLRV